MENKKVVVDNMDAYSWECPSCGQFNMHDKYSDAICDGCALNNDVESGDIETTEVEAYSWECPECGQFNVHDKYCDAICDECGNVFEPIESK